MLLISIHCTAVTHSDSWGGLWKFSMCNNCTIVCKTDTGFPNILQFHAAELLKTIICMVFWDARVGLQHYHIAFAKCWNRSKASVCPKQRCSSCIGLYSTPRIIFRNSMPVLTSQKTFQDLFNFRLMFSSWFLFALRWTWKCLLKLAWEAWTVSSAWLNYRKITKTNPTNVVIYLSLLIFVFLGFLLFFIFLYFFKTYLQSIALFWILPLFWAIDFEVCLSNIWFLRTSLILSSNYMHFKPLPALFLFVENVIKSGIRNWGKETKETFNQNVESLHMWCMAPFKVLSILIFEWSNLKK